MIMASIASRFRSGQAHLPRLRGRMGGGMYPPQRSRRSGLRDEAFPGKPARALLRGACP